MKQYRYSLMLGSKKFPCPKCQKKTFTPYINSISGEIVNSSKYGLCDRKYSCKYSLYPKSDGSDIDKADWEAPEIVYHVPNPDFIDRSIVEASFHQFNSNVFFMWLRKMFGMDKAYELQEMYNIGTAKNNGTIFWQQDSEGNFRTGKVMYYNQNGKRRKDRNSWYVHNRIKEDYELHQVFYGEHLINGNEKPIAICESEKTAILMSVFEPDYIWLASGGANMLNSYRLLRLNNLDLVAPDEGEFEKWEKQTNIFIGRKMDTRVETAVRNGTLGKGSDILDLILLEKQLC